MGLLDNNRFLFAGNQHDEEKALDLSSSGSVLLRIAPKKGYGCICLSVNNKNNLENVKLLVKKQEDSKDIPYFVDEKGEIHTQITSKNCGARIYRNDKSSNEYYIKSDELTPLMLVNANNVNGEVFVKVSYLKSIPSDILALKPTQILATEKLFFDGTYIVYNSNILYDEFVYISKYFKYLILQIKYFDSTGADKAVTSNIKMYPFSFFPGDDYTSTKFSLIYNTKEIINSESRYAHSSGYIENNFFAGMRAEISSDDFVIGDSVTFQILGVR